MGIVPCFLMSSQTCEFTIGVVVVTLPSLRCYRLSAMIGWPCVDILGLGEVVGSMCSFCLSVAAHTTV